MVTKGWVLRGVESARLPSFCRILASTENVCQRTCFENGTQGIRRGCNEVGFVAAPSAANSLLRLSQRSRSGKGWVGEQIANTVESIPPCPTAIADLQPRDTLSAATLLHLFYRDRVFGRDKSINCNCCWFIQPDTAISRKRNGSRDFVMSKVTLSPDYRQCTALSAIPCRSMQIDFPDTMGQAE